MGLGQQDQIQHLRRLLRTGRSASGSAEKSHQSESLGEAPVHADDVLHHVDTVLNRLPPDEVGDPAEFKLALQILMAHAEPALRKVLAPQAPKILVPDEAAALEALIIPDGSRPSFLLYDGQIKADHPFLGIWKDEMVCFGHTLRKLAAAVGRIQVPNGGPHNYSGTGTLVGEKLVLTNLHVVNHARNELGVGMCPQGDGLLNVFGDWVIDFVGESGTATCNQWRIKQVRVPKGAGEIFAGLDAAVLCIEPYNEQKTADLPTPVKLSADIDYATGSASPSFATIGFPGWPKTTGPKAVTVDWDFVIKKLFNERFGLKRVAPGKVLHPIGSVAESGHVLTHDATTFGGASGSLLFAWKNDDSPAFALHFAGATLTANYAVSLHKVADALRAIGLDIH